MNAFFEAVRCGPRAHLADGIRNLEKLFSTLGDNCRGNKHWFDKAACYRGSVNTCAQMIYHWHFGFHSAVSMQEIINKGLELALEYFAVIVDRLPKATGDEENEVPWYFPYSETLLMATLASRSQDRTRISDFLHPNLAPEIIGAVFDIEPAHADVLLCIASSFQSSPMETARLEERVQQSRKSRPKLLFKAWRALQVGDRATFVSALADSTANFAKTTAADNTPLMAIALEESNLAALAYERGWTDLTFDLPVAARLVTHQSLELT